MRACQENRFHHVPEDEGKDVTLKMGFGTPPKVMCVNIHFGSNEILNVSIENFFKKISLYQN